MRSQPRDVLRGPYIVLVYQWISAGFAVTMRRPDRQPARVPRRSGRVPCRVEEDWHDGVQGAQWPVQCVHRHPAGWQPLRHLVAQCQRPGQLLLLRLRQELRGAKWLVAVVGGGSVGGSIGDITYLM